MSEQGKLLRSASLITAITLVSRVFGYVRDQRVAFLLGAGIEADAYTIAYRIPNLLRRLVGEGAVSAAFIPIFSNYLSRENRKDAWEFANSMLTIVTLVMSGVTVIGIVAAPLLVRAIAYGFVDTPGKIELTALLTRVMFPYIFLVSLSALAMGVLNSFHKFAAPAFAPVLLNMSIIGCSFVTGFFESPERALAVGVVIGGIAQIVIQVPQLIRNGWRFRPRLNFSNPGVRRAAKLMGPVVVGVGVVQINIVVGGQFASFLGDGPQMALYLSDRVMELVLGGYAIAIATVVLPMLSGNAASGDIDQMRSTLNFASRIILFVTVPSTVGLVLLRTPIIQVLFEHGEFDQASTALTTLPLLFFALGLSAFAMVKVIVPAFLCATRHPDTCENCHWSHDLECRVQHCILSTVSSRGTRIGNHTRGSVQCRGPDGHFQPERRLDRCHIDLGFADAIRRGLRSHGYGGCADDPLARFLFRRSSGTAHFLSGIHDRIVRPCLLFRVLFAPV